MEVQLFVYKEVRVQLFCSIEGEYVIHVRTMLSTGNVCYSTNWIGRGYHIWKYKHFVYKEVKVQLSWLLGGNLIHILSTIDVVNAAGNL